MFLTRRQFMKASAGTIVALAIADKALALTALQPVIEVGNPLGEYPDRPWERVYHDQYRYDSWFTYICTPNATHACRIRAFVRNGVVMRVEQNYDHQTYEDLYGNRGTFAHNPRMCLKGYTFHRRVYGPYRLKGPLMRRGWKEWMDAGSPELTPEVKRKYKFDSRFLDDMVRVSWDTAYTYLAKAVIVVATRYSGEAGARRLREQGYPPEMIEMMKGAGVRCFKHRAGMPVLGIIGKMMNTRFNGAGLPGGGDHAGVQPDGDAGRLLDSGAAGDGCGAVPGHHQDHHRREHARRRLHQGVHGHAAVGPDGYVAVSGPPRCDQGFPVPRLLAAVFRPRAVVEAGPGRAVGRVHGLGPGEEAGNKPGPW